MNAPPSQYPEASGWWPRASQAQRLAQLDGGIECRMTAAQIAINVGANVNAVRQFAYAHGRKIRGQSAARAAMNSIQRDRRAFLRGDPMRLYGQNAAADEFLLEQAEA